MTRHHHLLLYIPLVTCPATLHAQMDISTAAASHETHAQHDSTFNPNIAIILGGSYSNTSGSFNPTGLTHLSFDNDSGNHNHAVHHSANDGFNLDDSLISFSADIDPYSKGHLAIGFNDQEAYIDEAYVRYPITAPLTLSAGRLRSQISPRNLEHHHQWNLTDMPLPYQAFLGPHGLLDDGVSVLWQPSNSTLQTGLELFQGKQQTILGVKNNESSPNVMTAFARINATSNLQLGAWAAHARHGELLLNSGHGGHSHTYTLSTNQIVYGVQAIHRSGKLALSTELMQSISHFDDAKRIRHTGSETITANELHRFGYAIETAYSLAPRWQVAGRIDGLTHQRYVFSDNHQFDVGASLRSSLAVNYYLTQNSRLRTQINYGVNQAIEDSTSTQGTTWLISYNINFGQAHHTPVF